MFTFRRLGAAVLVAVALGVLVAGGRLASTGLSIAEELTAARAAVADIDDLDDLDEATGTAQGHLARAQGLAERIEWRLARRVPLLSGSVRTVDDVTHLADELVTLAVGAAPATELARGELRTDDGHLDPDRLQAIRDTVVGLDTAPVRAAHARLEGHEPTVAPARIHEARAEALAAGAELADGVELAQAGATLAADLLGVDGARSYLLGMQNPAELRGTGGLIGQVGVLDAAGGRLSLRDMRSYTDLVGEIERPEELRVADEFEARYGHVAASTFFGNVNVDPDLPTVAPVMLGLYRAQTGDDLDGVLLVDPMGLEILMEATGPVDIPEEIAGDLPTTIGPEEVAEVTLVDAYVALGGRDERREAFLVTLTELVLDELLTLDPTDPEVVDALARAAAGRHVQVAATDEQVQRAAELLGVAGRLPDREESDLIAVTANNAGANKQDVHVAHGLTVHVELGEPRRQEDGGVLARRDTTYEVVVDNPLEPGQLTPYVIGSAPADARPFAGQTGPEALNRTWFTVWEREDAELLAASSSHGSPRVATGTVSGRRGFDHHLETQGPGREELTLTTRSRTRLHETDEGLRYELIVWRQPKAIADEIDLRIDAPAGWQVADARLRTARGTTLREPGEALGVDWPPELARHPTGVTVQGTLTTDVRLVLDLAR